MERLVEKVINLNYNDIENYKFPIDEFIGLKVIKNNVKYEFLLKLTDINKLICFGSGAVRRVGPGSIEPPVFNRYSWNVYFEESLIFYNDPTRYLNDEITIGWCVGTENDYYLETIADIIEKIVKSYNSIFEKQMKNSDILFTGSSGGGFTSIMLATMIKGSKVLVDNSQLFIKNYHDFLVDRLKKASFGELSDEIIFNEYGYRLDVLKMFKKQEYIPRIRYYVNINSDTDINDHCMPFIKGLEELHYYTEENKIEIIIYSGDSGHHPMNNADTIENIRNMLYGDYEHVKENIRLNNIVNKYKSRKIVKFANKLIKIKNSFLKIFHN